MSVTLGKAGLLLQAQFQPGEAVRAALLQPADAMLAQLAASGLRGRGGAGFPTATKWQVCRDAPGTQKVVVCNADESEPGTFKDRYLLEQHAHQVIEGMTLCALVIGADTGFMYLRGEYAFLLPHLEAVLAERRRLHLLGPAIGGKTGCNFDVQIHLGAGSYVCGEESALLESLEGKRGIPRKRPPFPVTAGYLGRPTVVNNVETLFAAAAIAVQGADWFRAQGTQDSAGTRLFSISGDCNAGVYELPFGISVRELLAQCGARETAAVLVSGAAGDLVHPQDFARRLCYEDLSCNGSLMVFDRSRDLLAILHNIARFFQRESCGFCTPCRVGTSLQVQQLDKLVAGKATQGDMQILDAISTLLAKSSHCGLGQRAAHVLDQARQQFADTFAACVVSDQIVPSFDVAAATAAARRLAEKSRHAMEQQS